MIKAVLFDLDGTLLPMDEEYFKKIYFGEVYKKIAYLGYTLDELLKVIWYGTKKMIQNDGSQTNEELFWKSFIEVHPDRLEENKANFVEFYNDIFPTLGHTCGFQPLAKDFIKALKDKGYEVIIASNPIFPIVATKARIRWAGLNPDDFKYITAYENSSFSKPNLKYYEEVLEKTGYKPEEVVMVGNDVREDMIVNQLGIDSYLITDCLLNLDNEDINKYKHGNFKEVMDLMLARL